jgi:cell division septal protein FtsQ
MASRQHKAQQPEGRPSPEQSASPTGPAWRQPPPETRASVRRQQMTVQRSNAAPRNPLAPIFSRALELGQSMTLRHWVALLVVTAAAVGISQLLTLPQFSVTGATIQVRGNQRISADEVSAASGLKGANVFQVQAGSVAGRVADIPGVEAVRVHVRLPANVIIDVAELAPLAILHTVTDTLWIGSDGTVIQQVGEPPMLTLVEANGTVRDARGIVIPEVVRGLEAIHANRPDLTDLYYGTLEGLYFRASEGYTVYLGAGGAMDRKLALLEATQQQITDRGTRPQVVDLRFDGYAMLR